MEGGCIEAQGVQLTSCFLAGAPREGRASAQKAGLGRAIVPLTCRGEHLLTSRLPPAPPVTLAKFPRDTAVAPMRGNLQVPYSVHRVERRLSTLLDLVSHLADPKSGVEAGLPRCEIRRPKNRRATNVEEARAAEKIHLPHGRCSSPPLPATTQYTLCALLTTIPRHHCIEHSQYSSHPPCRTLSFRRSASALPPRVQALAPDLRGRNLRRPRRRRACANPTPTRTLMTTMLQEVGLTTWT